MILAWLSPTLVWPVLWIVLVAAVMLSALYSAMETGVYVTNKVRLELHAESGSPAARRLRDMLKNPNNLLVVLLVGVNLANYAAAFVVSTMFVLAGSHEAEWYALAVVTPVMFILGESVPKNVSQRLGERLMYPLTGVLRLSVVVLNVVGLALVVRGFTHLVMRVTRAKPKHSPLGYESFSTIVAEGQASGVLTHTQSIMADRIMHIQDVHLRNVMIPMARVVSAPRDITREQLLELLRNHEYSRLPVLDAAGQVAGVLDIYDVLSEGQSGTDTDFEQPKSESVPAFPPPQSKMTEPLVLDNQMIVTDALYQMQRSRRMMAIVSGPGGKHVGIVTIKDIVEEIVGELEAW